MYIHLFFLFLLTSTTVFGQIHPIPNFDIRPDGIERLKELLDEHDDNNAPGFSLLIGTPDTILFSHYTGVANLRPETNIDRNTPFYIASIGKTMTAFAILKLREENKLSLSDPLTKYIPEAKAIGQNVTIMHLLTHRSGIPDYYKILGDEAILTNNDIVALVSRLDSLNFAPGYKYAYSNTAYVLLAEIIEQVSGMSYATYLSRSFFEPLGMENTSVFDDPTARPDHAAVGYYNEDEQWQLHDRKSFVTGSGGIYSTVDDLYLWYKAILSYDVVSKRSVELAFHMPSTLSGSVSYMAMGWFNETFGSRTPEVEGLPVFGSLGVYRGFRSMFLIYPQQNLVAILLTNTGAHPFGSREIANAMLERM